jgi:hypothetical protein
MHHDEPGISHSQLQYQNRWLHRPAELAAANPLTLSGADGGLLDVHASRCSVVETGKASDRPNSACLLPFTSSHIASIATSRLAHWRRTHTDAYRRLRRI